jgi:DNA repair protein RecN (Recombination protein N)
LLVDIHGQHAHQSLLAAAAQRELLDASADHAELRQAVADAYGDWQRAERELAQRSQDSAERDARLDLLQFQLGEIDALAIGPGESGDLRQESERLRHVDELQQAIGGATEALYESESANAYGLTSAACGLIEAAASHDSGLTELLGRLQSTEIEIREIANELSHRLDALEADPARLEVVESRLNRLQQIARRHRVPEEDVHALAGELRLQINSLDSGAASLARLEELRLQAADNYQRLARLLSASRATAAAELSRVVTEKLRELGLPAARFCVEMAAKADSRADSTGIDRIEFQVSTNPGLPPGPIERVASGGELSRIGLALAVVATDPSSIPTLIFDEVDSGIGGAVAEVVGRRLREIADRHQVMCVTHLPQVASQGTRHYRIVKNSNEQRTSTQVVELDSEQRIEELSRMLGGVRITATTRAHAQEMIRQAAGG